MSVIMAVLCGKIREVVATAQENVRGKMSKVRERVKSMKGEDEQDAVGTRRSSLIVRSLSGAVVLEKDAVTAKTPVSKIIQDVCEQTGADRDTIQLCAGGQILRHSSQIGESFAACPSFLVNDEEEEAAPVELTIMRLSGPPITVEATSRREIKLLDGVPSGGSRCHLDRSYRFISLGDFAGKDRMRYLMTSNDDKNMTNSAVMWKISVMVPVVVYLNFRSESHVQNTGATRWLQDGGWTLCPDMKSTVSTGVPHGPYSGPIYSKAADHGDIEMMGSNCSEGTYFVFVEVDM